MIKQIEGYSKFKSSDFENCYMSCIYKNVGFFYKSSQKMFTFYAMEWLYSHMKNYKGILNESIFNRLEYDLEKYVDAYWKHLLGVIEFSCLSEIRHYTKMSAHRRRRRELKEQNPSESVSDETYLEFINCFNSKMKREDSVKAMRKLIRCRKKRMLFAKDLFSEKLRGGKRNVWFNEFGGEAWANGCEVWLSMVEAKTLFDKIFWIDQALDLQHNSGCLFNKHKEYSSYELYFDYLLDYRHNVEGVEKLMYYFESIFKRVKDPGKHWWEYSKESTDGYIPLLLPRYRGIIHAAYWNYMKAKETQQVDLLAA